jgi:hypothetical protein
MQHYRSFHFPSYQQALITFVTNSRPSEQSTLNSILLILDRHHYNARTNHYVQAPITVSMHKEKQVLQLS